MIYYLNQRKDRDPSFGTTLVSYQSITDTMYDDWLLTSDNGLTRQLQPTTAPGATVNGPTQPARASSTELEVERWKKGIRRDPTLFPTLKDAPGFSEWHDNVIALSAAMDISDVLDPTYAPDTDVDKAVFRLKQDFMYPVFRRVLLVPWGKELVRNHNTDRDAQKVFAGLLDRFKKSAEATFSAADTLQYITTAKLGKNSSWRGSMENFLIHWNDQVRLYNERVDITEVIPSPLKMTLLQTAVNDVPELAEIKATSDQLTARTLGIGTGLAPMDYDHYYALLISAATRMDRRIRGTTPAGNRTRRAVYATEQYSSYDPDDHYDSMDDIMYDIDTDPYTIMVNAAMRQGNAPSRNTNTRVSHDVWNLMAPAERTAWNAMRPAVKAKITSLINL